MPAPHDQSRHPIVGIAFKLASIVLLTAMAACVKYLGSDVPPGQVIFFRGLISVLVLSIVAWRGEGLALLKTRNWRGHASRSIAGSLSMFCWFLALTLIPLAQMMAISFTIPIFVTVLAMVFLGERIHAYRWTALGIGFLGVVVIVAPQLEAGVGSGLGTLIGLAAAVMAAFALMFLRRMSGEEHALTITFYFFLTSTVLAAATAVLGWPMPTPEQWFVLGLVGLFGVSGQLLMAYSFRYAEASLVAPLDYVGLVIAVAVGFYVFDEIPSLSTWVGAPLVIVSGLIILWREYTRFQRVVPVTEPVPPPAAKSPRR